MTLGELKLSDLDPKVVRRFCQAGFDSREVEAPRRSFRSDRLLRHLRAVWKTR